MTIETACDTARVLTALGRVSDCSDDRVTIWHGMSTPAIACGFHGRPNRLTLIDVFRGHRARLGETVTVTTIYAGGRSETVTIPTDA